MVKNNSKKVLSVLLAVLIVLSSFSVVASAYTIGSKIHSSQKPTNYKYIKYWGEDGSTMAPSQRGWETFYKRTIVNPDTQKVTPAYCLEFGKDYSDNLNPTIKDIENTSAWKNATATAKNGVRSATIYGYPNQYGEYGDAAYYATQVIIWEYMLGYRTSASTDPHSGFNGGYDTNNIACRFLLGIETKNYSDVYTVYKNILSDIARHKTTVNFNDSLNLKLSYNVSTKKYEGVFTDKNNILSKFDISEHDSRINVSKSGNKLTITADNAINASNVANITFQKRFTCVDDGVALFVDDVRQTLIVGTLADPQIRIFNVYTDVGNVDITKKSEDNNVANIQFKIDCSASGFSKTYTTDANGKISISDLPAGLEYTITEITPSAYVPLSPQKFTLTSAGVSFQFNNHLKKGSLTINKIDAEDGSAISGTKFVISKGDTFDATKLLWNDEIDDDYFVTDESGQIFINNLSIGKYVVKEFEATKGYKSVSTEYPVEIVDATTNISITVENEKQEGSLVLLKYVRNQDGTPALDDNGDYVVVKGVKFEIRSADDGSLVDTINTLNNGRAIIALPVGNYTLYEIDAPDGLFFNPDRAMNISITDPTTPKIVTIGDYSIEAYINKVDAAGNRLTGATFSVFEADANYNIINNTPIFSGVTESDKDLKIENLTSGYFVVKETAAPNGFALPENNFIANLSVLADTASPSKPVITFSNYNPDYTQEGNKLKVVEKETGITIHKIDENGNPLSGVIFELIGENSQKITDANGNVSFTKLTAGKVYSFKEVKTKDGYYTDNTIHTFVVDKYGKVDICNTVNAITGYPEFVVENEKTEFIIYKFNENDEPLEGAYFDIYASDGTKLDEYSSIAHTDSEGKIVFSGMPEGDYYAIETKSPNGYILDDTRYGFTIGFDAAKTLRIVNTRTSVILIKTDAATGSNMENVEFGLYDSEDNLIGTYKTDAEGKIRVENEPLLVVDNDYYFQEKASVSGYYANDTKYSFTLDKHGNVIDDSGSVVASIEATNIPTLFYIDKVDADNNNRLSGVVFAIYASDGTFKGSFTTDNNGEIKLEKFDEGEYYAVETSFPTGYIHDNSPHNFSIISSTNGSHIVISNRKTTVTLSKVDLVNGKPVEGATIEIYNDAGELVYAGISDKTGKISVDYLPVGHYTFKETINPEGYQINTGVYEFTINEDGSITNGYAIEDAPTEVVITKTDEDGNLLKGATIGVYDAAGTLVYKGVTNELGEIRIQYLPSGIYTYKELKAPDGFKLNKEVYTFTINRDGSVAGDNVMIDETTSVTITKTDVDGVPLQGATIAVFDENGEEIYRDVTNEFGKISISGLHTGKYLYKEIECPDGYVLDTNVYDFSIDEEGNVDGENVIVNEATSIIITKTDENGKPIEGATIGIYSENDELLFTLVTDENGQIKVENLLSGKYYFKEILPAEGYEINENKYEFEITREGATLGADSLINKLTEVTILKTDINGNPLEGAVIQITDKDGNIVFEGTTDSEGKIVIKGLKPGDYFAQEIKAPKGYKLNSEKVVFKVNETGIAQGDFVIKNELEPIPTTPSIPKTGDSVSFVLLTIVAVASGIVAGTTYVYPYLLKKKKEKSNA